ncbi:hypothetical protein Agub_g8072, partial [Astrephomene gubernaculifera]
MESLASSLETVLMHAVAALEHEDRGEPLQGLQEYNNAWAALSCALEVHGNGAEPSCFDPLPGLVREICSALLDTYTIRHEAIRSMLQSAGPSHSCISARRYDDLGQPSEPAAGNGNRSDRPYTPSHPTAHALSSNTTNPTHAYHTQTGTDGSDASRRDVGRPPGTPIGGAHGVVLTAVMMDVLQQCQRPVAAGGSLDDMAGLDSVKEEVRLALLLPMRMPHVFRGIRQPPRNFLLHGPPGTGKTMLVERIAAEAGATLLVLTPGAVLSKWSGESEKQLRAVFELARAMQPCIVFMDEVDSLAPARGPGDDP